MEDSSSSSSDDEDADNVVGNDTDDADDNAQRHGEYSTTTWRAQILRAGASAGLERAQIEKLIGFLPSSPASRLQPVIERQQLPAVTTAGATDGSPAAPASILTHNVDETCVVPAGSKVVVGRSAGKGASVTQSLTILAPQPDAMPPVLFTASPTSDAEQVHRL